MKTYTEADMAEAWDAGYQWCYDDGAAENPYARTKENGLDTPAKKSVQTVTSTRPNTQEEVPVMKNTPSIADTTPRTIWKKAGLNLHHGPSAVLKDVGFHFDSEYSDEKGVHFWGNLERESEEYSLAEVRNIHRALGRLLGKVDADPKPRTAQDA